MVVRGKKGLLGNGRKNAGKAEFLSAVSDRSDVHKWAYVGFRQHMLRSRRADHER